MNLGDNDGPESGSTLGDIIGGVAVFILVITVAHCVANLSIEKPKEESIVIRATVAP